MGQNNSAPIAGLDDRYLDLVTGGFKIGGVKIPNYFWIVLTVAIAIWFVWNKTRLGKNMFAVGTNPEAATVSGVSVAKTIVIVFALAGILYGISAFVESARVSSNSTATGVNYELDAIAACVIGGVSFMGGIGKIKGVVIGVILLQLVNAGLVFLNLRPEIQTIVKGAIILISCAEDYEIDREHLEDSRMVHTVEERVRQQLGDLYGLVRQAMEICQLPAGPYMYADSPLTVALHALS